MFTSVVRRPAPNRHCGSAVLGLSPLTPPLVAAGEPRDRKKIDAPTAKQPK